MANKSKDEIIRWATLQYVSADGYEWMRHLIVSDANNQTVTDVRDLTFTIKKLGRLEYDRKWYNWVLVPDMKLGSKLGYDTVQGILRAFEAAHASMGWLNYLTEDWLLEHESIDNEV